MWNTKEDRSDMPNIYTGKYCTGPYRNMYGYEVRMHNLRHFYWIKILTNFINN